ncbi:MAG: hypothetical protein A2Y76_06510 [Planctomycetes bacterium RBG_13_60_9]|nr:MAG: hypothetical protein A2Y76_06510 [Planctomycetes bacterium RBG_13_60_9]
MNSEISRQHRRFRLKGWHVILLAVAVLVGALCLYVVIRRGETARRLAALCAAGYPTSMAELAEYNKLPAGTANAAEVYLEGFAAYVPPLDGANMPHLGTAQWPQRGSPLPEPMVKAIAQCLADNQQCLSLLHEAAGIQDCDYDWDWRQYAPTGFTQLADVRHCAQLLTLGEVYYAQAGDPNTALRCVEDGLRLADSLRREPALIHYLVRVACIGLVLGNLDRSLSATAFTDRQLARLNEIVMATDGTLDLTQALITERCIMLETCKNPFLLAGTGQGPGPRMLPGMTGMGISDILNYTDDCVEASRLPPAERLTRFRAATKKAEDLSFVHVMIKMLAPAMGRVAELDLRTRAGIDLARTALAIERYRLATGKVPEKLEELVPQYIKEVPTDPFDGKPIRYKRTEPGYLLYSILEDGQDNGGRERGPTNRNQPYDWPFIVTR